MRDVYIFNGYRTGIGKALKGTLKDTRPDELLAFLMKKTVEKVGIDPQEVDDCIIGCAFPEGEQGMNVARIALLRAGFPVDIAGMTVNRFCASGLEAIVIAIEKVRSGIADLVLAGGVESMSRVPMGGVRFLPNPELALNYPEVYLSMGLTAERVAEKYNISREDQDKFALQSHKRAVEAHNSGKFKDEIIPYPARMKVSSNGNPEVKEVVLDRDEGMREDTSLEKLSELKPVFKKDGTVTAGNSSQMSDGSAMVIVATKEKGGSLGLKPELKLLSYAVAGVPPEIMGIGPVSAIPEALKRAQLEIKALDLIELNEAFAAQSIAVIRELNLDIDKVNVNGGAIAVGHPLGCTGAKLTVNLMHEITRRKDAGIGCVTMCIGGGMGAAGIFEKI